MPIVFVNWTEGQNEEIKEKVAKGITEGISKGSNLPPERVTIIFNDIPKGNLANNGKIINR